jgi:galactokinase
VAGKTRVRGYRAPGRVNLIGEHTDYNQGFVLPIAIGLQCEIHVATIRKRELRVYSAEMKEEVTLPLDAVEGLERRGHWSDYVFGVAKELAAAGVALKPRSLSIHSSVPSGSGLSSSAALEVATALALLDGRPFDRLELARLCQRAERNFVGMPCGIMDQYASLFGVNHAALFLDCRSVTHSVAPLPPNLEVVAINTMVKHELGQSAYRERVAECAAALTHFPGRASLREVTLGELEREAPRMAEVPLARARHVILECLRVERFVAAAAAGDLAAMGKLFIESHESLRDDYQVSCAELNFLVGEARRIPGCYGARMTGGGFGGCTVNLVEPKRALSFVATMMAAYESRYGTQPDVYRCTPSEGAGPLEL